MRLEIQVFSSAADLAQAAAKQFVTFALAAVYDKGIFSVALSGGSTPKELYELLADERERYSSQLPWNDIHFFWTDERHVPPENLQSNYRMAHEAMLSRASVNEANVHRIRGELADAAKASNEYEDELRRFFQLTPNDLPRFDLILLGLGADGHTASIFAGSEVLDERDRLVAATWVEKLESFRITLTPPVLNNAATIIFLVSGAGKAEVLRDVLEGDFDPDRLPAQIIKPVDGMVYWFVDQPAARLLSKRTSRG